MARNMSDRVAAAQRAGMVPETDEEIAIAERIAAKHGAEPGILLATMVAIVRAGLGRNAETAKALRAVADIIESPIETAETIEARLDGKLQ